MSLTKALVICSLGIAMGCSQGSDNKSGNNNQQAQDQERWPGTSNYSTSFSYNGCKDTYEAKSQAEFCRNLTDQEKSQCPGNLSARKSAYKNECGDDFAQINIGGFQISGYDDDLKTQCHIGTEKRFATETIRCNYLKDESEHKSCFWSSRKRMFGESECNRILGAKESEDLFSPKPVVAEVPAATNPGSTAPATPGQTMPSRPASALETMVAHYAAVGIEVKISSMGSSFSYLNWHGLLPISIKMMDEMVSDFAARKSSIKSIELSGYTSYHESTKTLYLGVGLEKVDAQKYLSLHDQRISLSENSGLILDLGIEIFSGDLQKETDKLAYFKKAISFFTSLKPSLKELSKVLKTIEISDTHYLKFYDGSYEIKRENFEEQFKKDLALLKGFAALGAQGITFENYFDLDKHTGNLGQFLSWAQSNSLNMKELKEAMGQLTISLEGDSDADASFYPSLNKIFIGINKGFKASPGLNQLMSLSSLLNDLKCELEIEGDNLDADFVSNAEKLKQRRSKLLAHKSKIKKLYFTGSDTSFSYGTLYVGSKDSLAKLDQALSLAAAAK